MYRIEVQATNPEKRQENTWTLTAADYSVGNDGGRLFELLLYSEADECGDQTITGMITFPLEHLGYCYVKYIDAPADATESEG